MTEKRSDAITQGFERTPHRALLKGTGIPQDQMDKPFIGIASSFTDLIPGHTGMRDLERFIEKGVHTGGGYSFIFGIPGVCDGIAMGHKGMHYSLPTRSKGGYLEDIATFPWADRTRLHITDEGTRAEDLRGAEELAGRGRHDGRRARRRSVPG